MYNCIVMTSGISLLSNFNEIGKFIRSISSEYGVVFERHNPKVQEGYTEADCMRRIVEKVEEYVQTLDFETCSQAISAEYSMIAALGSRLEKDSVLHLFHTNTFGGKLAAVSLQTILSYQYGYVLYLHQIEQFDVYNRHEMNEALGTYMRELSDVLESCYPRSTIFAPIGGYKVMTSLGYIVGSFHGFETAYMNEEAQVLHHIPPVPIDIKESFFKEQEDLLRKLVQKRNVNLEELSEKEREIVQSYTTLFYIFDNEVDLNPFGRFLFERSQYVSKLHTKIYLSEEAVKLLKHKRNDEHFTYRQLHELQKKIKQDAKRTCSELYHETEFKKIDRSQFQFHLYKGNRKPNFRCTWKYDREADALYINYLWIQDHDDYEKEVGNQGIGLIHQAGKWKDCSEDFYASYMK